VIQFTPPGPDARSSSASTSRRRPPARSCDRSPTSRPRDELVAHGVDATSVPRRRRRVRRHGTSPICLGGSGSAVRPRARSYRSFVSFSDPDGNGWLTGGRAAPGPGVTLNVAALAQLCMRAEHHGCSKRAPRSTTGGLVRGVHGGSRARAQCPRRPPRPPNIWRRSLSSRPLELGERDRALTTSSWRLGCFNA
jgi:hypothetical protein